MEVIIDNVSTKSWLNTDYINVSDYERIRKNVKILIEKAKAIDNVVATKTMMFRDISYFPYAYDWNAFESNLKEIYNKTHNATTYDLNALNFGFRYADNGNYISATQLNQIEGVCQEFNDGFNTQAKYLPKLMMRLGGAKPL